jgi:molybdopterin converting factor small subunit
VHIRVVAFATAAEALGHGELEVELPAGATVAALLALLGERAPRLLSLLPRLATAVDGELVGAETPLPDGAEVALLPPVSGGKPPAAWLSDDPLDAVAISAAVAGADCGAVVLFVGTVRDHHAGRAVERLGYTAYRPMAERLPAASPAR